MNDLWESNSLKTWRASLARYADVIARQEVAKLPDLDAWYQYELPIAIGKRRAPHVTHAEMVKVTEWKMARGVWRAPNLVLVLANDADTVVATSTDALAKIPHPKQPIVGMATLGGVGPATASAVVAAAAPHLYPFFDELVAAQVPSLGKVVWTLGYYLRYADALRARAAALGNDWTPSMVERALWTNVGGKTGVQ